MAILLLSFFTCMVFQIVDINECKDVPCTHPNSECINTDGSFYCVCSKGYTGNETDCSAGKTQLAIKKLRMLYDELDHRNKFACNICGYIAKRGKSANEVSAESSI